MLSTAQLLTNVNRRPTIERVLRNNVISVDFKTKEIKKSIDTELFINPHFVDYINDWSRYYYVVVGGYGSSKSYNTAYKIIIKLIEEKRTCLVIREVFDTHKDSTFSLFQDIIENNEVFKSVCTCKQSPLSIRFLNGSKIIFKGMDKPEKLKSIHNISIVWLEEATEVKYEGFKEIIGRLRHPKLSLHVILTSNPVSKSSWVYKRFFIDEDDPENTIITLDDEELYKDRIIIDDSTYYHHSTCDDNMFLSSSYIKQLDEMKTYDPYLYEIARNGRFGVNGLRVFPQFQIMDREQVADEISNIKLIHRLERYGMDFGFVTSYNALVGMIVDTRNHVLYLTSCYYSKEKTDDQIARDIADYMDVEIRSDCAEPKAIRYYQQTGFNMRKCKKFKGSRRFYTQKVKRFRRIVCCSDLKPIIKELRDLTFKVDKDGNIVEDEFNIDPHTLSAIWYGLDDYEVPDLKRNVKSFAKKKKGGISI